MQLLFYDYTSVSSFYSPDCEHLHCNCLKKMLPNFISSFFFFFTPHTLEAIGCNMWSRCLKEPFYLARLLPSHSMRKGLTAARAKWDFTPLFFSKIPSLPVMFFFHSPLVFLSSTPRNVARSHVHKTKALEGNLRCTDGTKLNWKSN